MTGVLLWIGERALWFAVGLGVWLVICLAVGIPVGRLLRRRSEELPHE